MSYSLDERNVIIADSLEGLTYTQKRAFLCAADEKHPQHIKYADLLIKSLGGGVYNKLKALFCDRDYRNGVARGLSSRGITCVTIKSPDYPELLKNTPAPPLVLYCKGRAELLRGDCFAVVGSRRTPAGTLAACKKISGELAQKFTVVTGIADGADTAAIQGAVGSGNIICVLPGGHDYIYNSSNAALIKEVEQKGLTISEWSPKTPVQKFMYSVRNRIIAGLARGVLVVSAPKKSGALITAGYAADYGREVFAFPHSLGVSSGEGCNNLIKNGAMLCQNVLDILSDFGLEYKSENIPLTAAEQKVLDCLRNSGSAHIQAIARAAGIKVFEAVTILSSLEIKGLVARSGGNTYQAV